MSCGKFLRLNLVWIVTALAFGLSLSVSTAATAAEVRCEDISLFPAHETGIGHRGFLGTTPASSPETARVASTLDILGWGLRIYVQPNEEAMVAHDSQEPNVLMKGVYLKGNVDLEPIPESELPALFSKLVTGGMYWVNNGKVETVDPQLVAERFTPEKLEKLLELDEQGPCFMQKGWFSPKYHGVILEADANRNVSDAIKKIEKISRTLVRQGVRVSFNKDFKGVLEKLATQQRTVVSRVTKKRIVREDKGNRYREESVRKEAQARFDAGDAFSIEVWDVDGKLVAGVMGFFNGNLYSPDSVFYDPDYIDYAKLAVLALRDRLKEKGIKMIDAGMVTKFTAGLKGTYISPEKYRELKKTLLPDEIQKVDFETDWVPEGL